MEKHRKERQRRLKEEEQSRYELGLESKGEKDKRK